MVRASEIPKLLFICGLLNCPWPPDARAQEPSPPVIDVHAHLVPDKGLSFEAALDSAIQTMNANRIATTILMSPPRARKIRQNYDEDDFREVLSKYPGRFVYLGGGGTLNPIIHSAGDMSNVTSEIQSDFSAEAEKLITDGIRGFGEMCGLHISLFREHAYSYVPADHPLFMELADIAAKHDLPIDLHVDAVSKEMKPPARLAAFPNNPATFPETLAALERLLAHNRNAKIVWAHGGTDHTGDFGAKTISDLMDRHPNLYVSLKATGTKASTFNRMFTGHSLDPAWSNLFRRYPDRFMIGTDSFYASPDSSTPLSNVARQTPFRMRAMTAFLQLLPPDIAKKFARDNAIRIYGLTPDQAPAEVSAMRAPATTPQKAKTPGRTCRDGNLEHCKIACQRGRKQACRKLNGQ